MMKENTILKKLKENKKAVIAISCAALCLVLMIVSLSLRSCQDETPPETQPTQTAPTTQITTAPTTVPTTVPTTAPTTVPTTQPTETGPQMLDFMAELYNENPDVVGWVRIDGTVIDYPVMYTPEDEYKYLYKNFQGEKDKSGLPFIEADCSLDPESDNLIIHGHNMRNGTMFHSLLEYRNKSYWKEHPTIYFATLYEERTYEIVAAFYDKVYYKTDDCFKFYEFINAANEEEFNEAISYFKKKDRYETGVTAEYGDDLIMLVTCAYHTEDGRFVVVAKRVDHSET